MDAVWAFEQHIKGPGLNTNELGIHLVTCSVTGSNSGSSAKQGLRLSLEVSKPGYSRDKKDTMSSVETSDRV
jgi:hypothetical protein